MKKLWVIAGSVLLFFSCVLTTKVGIVFDDSIPVEQTAQICFNAVYGTITAYNGINVDWKHRATETIQIPAGETQLLWGEFNAYFGNYTFKAKNMVFVYNFQPGKKYLFESWVDKSDEENLKYGLKVYTYDPEEKITLGNINDHFTGFVPFVNQPGSQKTVLD
jgi:hypothetical protein